jgi:carbon monoxide dehydrogenase subunit G
MAFSMTGAVELRSDLESVWAGLLDPEILRQSVPGCQSLESDSDTHYRAVVKVKIGPIAATFRGAVELTDLEPPYGCRIIGSGDAGVAGGARGGAKVRLARTETGVSLSYEVEANITGKIAQLGSRMIDGVAKKLADQFFANFVAALEPEVSAAEAEARLEKAPGA